jgi:SRSO17 transposase
VTAQLSLPEAWATEGTRRAKVPVPTEVSLGIKPELALTLVDQARAWGAPFAWVVADARQVASVVGVSSRFGGRLPDEVHAAALVLPSRPRGRGQPKKPRPAPFSQAKAVLAARASRIRGYWRQTAAAKPGCR